MDVFTVSPVPGRESVFRLRGELDVSTAATLEETVAGSVRHVTFDCAELGFIDSSGLRALVRVSRSGGLTLINVTDNVLRVLEFTGLDYLCEPPDSG
jgi:anti-anti-sigma factor